MSEALTLISGIICVIGSFNCLYILKMDFETKRHMLRMFQLGMFGIMLVVGIVQIVAVIVAGLQGSVPNAWYNLLSVSFILMALLQIPYLRYNKRKKSKELKA